MFGIADQYDERKTNQSGANPGIFGGQRVSRLSGQTPNRPVHRKRSANPSLANSLKLG